MFIYIFPLNLCGYLTICIINSHPSIWSENIMSFNIDNIIGIVSPGLNNNTNQRDPCSLCNNRVKCNQYAIKCTLCDKLVHIKCNGTSKKDYENSINQDTAWSCLLCIIQDNLTNVPFIRCGNKELENINNSNTMAFVYQTIQ